ncbi:hypothetical protein [Pseudomonas fluorescens]|uniref:Short-chain dehydrogenase n=1 Tax=Pseudomonas fluorescens TaxID=294 RepID=A0A5E7EHR6_PSEFL|nr:hypothetical protein [Pseudomonas fluorescens]VVO26172.1 hypothetical protein PS723_04617 [Pseudomonas fluorescens]
MKTLTPDPPFSTAPTHRYMPLTSNDCDIPTLFVDTLAPLDVLQDAADYRIRAVTQLMENLAMREEIRTDAVILQDFARLCAIALRDGCDLLDVLGRRLQAQISK